MITNQPIALSGYSHSAETTAIAPLYKILMMTLSSALLLLLLIQNCLKLIFFVVVITRLVQVISPMCECDDQFA